MDKQIDAYISYLAMKKREVRDLVKLTPFYVLMFSQGPLTVSKKYGREDEILKGIFSATGRNVPVIGGSAGDDLKFVQSYVFRNGKVHKDSVVIMLLGSDVHIGVSLEHGYVPTEKTFMVTKTDGRLIHELNKKPALQEYCKAINVPVEEFKKEPLLYCKNVIGVPDGTGNYWSVVPGRVVGNALHTGSTVPKNTMICILEANEKMVLEAAKNAMVYAVKDAGSNDMAAALMFDCCIRWMNLKEKVAKEIKITQDVIGKDTPLIGFYTYGEHGARYLGAFCGHFNASTSNMVITNKLFAEK